MAAAQGDARPRFSLRMAGGMADYSGIESECGVRIEVRAVRGRCTLRKIRATLLRGCEGRDTRRNWHT